MGDREQVEDRYARHFAHRADALRSRVQATLDAEAFEELGDILGHLRAIIGLSGRLTSLEQRRWVMAAALAAVSR